MTPNATCTNSSQCSEHGFCIAQKCACIPFYSGNFCEINQIDSTPGLHAFFWTYSYLFGILFAGITVIVIFQFILALNYQLFIFQVLLVLYILLFLVGVTRCFFLLFDPYDVRGLLGPVGSQILFGFPIACLVNVYILIIRLWINMYNAVNYQKTLDHVFRYAGIAMALVFLVEFGYDLMDGLFGGGIVFSIMLAIYVVVLGLGVLILAVLFSIYSQKLLMCLQL